MTKYLSKIVLLVAFIFLGAISEIREAGEPRAAQMSLSAEAVAGRPVPHRDIRLEVRGGSFVLRQLTLNETLDSTTVKGFLVNRTGRKWMDVVFEIRAYNRNGDQIMGVEEETIFKVQRLGKGSTVAINSGYGASLQGIRLEDISSLEITFARPAQPSRNHARDLDIEE